MNDTPGVVTNPEVVKQLLVTQADAMEKLARVACGFQHSSAGTGKPARRWEDCIWRECQYARAGITNLRRLAEEKDAQAPLHVAADKVFRERVMEALGNGSDEARWAPGEHWSEAAARAIRSGKELTDAVRVARNAFRDVLTLGRFGPAVDPVRWVADVDGHLAEAIGEKPCERPEPKVDEVLANMTCGGCGERGHVTGTCPNRRSA